ncbi:cytochrome b5-like heme/steroid binding domain-containing protein [Xylariaceae sp. FL1651]|nr:cytochrome b5-like heme/steroid binding domain-containing protein [Xylariaceae sp. FL1651]
MVEQAASQLCVALTKISTSVDHQVVLANEALDSRAQNNICQRDERTVVATIPASNEKNVAQSQMIHRPAESKAFTTEEVSKHNTQNNMWLIIDNEVYDVTKFQETHPGGTKGVAGKDATKKFDKYHRRALLNQYKPMLRVGVLDSSKVPASLHRGLLSKLRPREKKTVKSTRDAP